MDSKSKVDYMIVGQGLAGSAVALQLLERGKHIMVFDEFRKNSASRIAAGLFNPVTGKNQVKTWMADVLFPYLEKFYTRAEQLTKKSFFHPLSIYRPFASIQEQNEWMGKSTDEAYSFFIDEISLESQYSETNDHFGGMRLKQSGYLNTISYLSSVRDRFEEYEELVVLDLQGKPIATSGNQRDSWRLPPDWRKELSSNGAIVGQATWDQSLGKGTLVVVVPVQRGEGRILGALAARHRTLARASRGRRVGGQRAAGAAILRLEARLERLAARL